MYRAASDEVGHYVLAFAFLEENAWSSCVCVCVCVCVVVGGYIV